MGLLIQTSVLIMVIALITYARLDFFIPRKAIESEMVIYMSHSEREWMNRVAGWYYQALHPNSKAPSSDENKEPQSNGIGYISLRPLFEEAPEPFNNTRILLKNLLTILYSKQPFVTHLIKNGAYPDASSLFIELIDAIILAGRNLPPEDRPKDADQFMQLDLGPLQPLFMNIVNGCSCFGEETSPPEEEEGASEFVPQNYCSLFSFATMVKGKTLSVYLAPEEILQAIYGNPQIVNELLQARRAAYKDYKDNKTPEARAALERYKTVQGAIDSKFLDFTVTTTNPDRKRTK